MLKIFVRINKDFYAFENYNIIFFSNRLIYNDYHFYEF